MKICPNNLKNWFLAASAWQQKFELPLCQIPNFSNCLGIFVRVALLCMCALPPSLQAAFTFTPQMREEIDQQIREFAAKEHGGGVAAAVIYPAPLLKQGYRRETFFYGHTKADGSPAPDGKTIFYLASLTKVFVATVLAKFISEGKVSLDDPAQKYVPAGVYVPSYEGREITIRDLVTHTSSLPRVPPRIPHPGHYTVEEFYDFLNHYKLKEPPGTKYLYSNLGFGFLGIILSNITHMDFQRVIITQMCEPLGMVNTRIWYSEDAEKQRPYFYNADGKRAVHILPGGLPALAGGGGFSSTLDDMSYFLAFNLGLLHTGMNDILPIIDQRAYTIKENTYMCLGWFEANLYPKSPIHFLFKNGGLPGVSTVVTFSLQSKTGVVILANCEIPTPPLSMSILKIMNPNTH